MSFSRILTLLMLVFLASINVNAQNAARWSPNAARDYLDGRMTWWIGWPVAARDHQTFCISCHTALPFALARPALRSDLGEQAASANEVKIIDNVTKRVRMWSEVEPFYPDAQRGVPKTAESRGTESVLDALILAWSEGRSADARLALDNMWALQLTTGDAAGAWNWLQFHNAPFEGDSQYYGATLAALAAGVEGDSPSAAVHFLRDYLVRNEGSQILFNRAMLLWASTKLKDLLTSEQQKAIVVEVLSKQQADGGFSMSTMVGDWKRRDKTPLETKSDGLATGLAVLALHGAGVADDQAPLQSGIAWLSQNQNKADGRWFAYSLNKERDLASDVGRFMSDAATSYAVLALEDTATSHPGSSSGNHPGR